MNATLEKFGYPDALVHENQHWAAVVRPEQVTLGAMVLGAKSDATALSALPDDAFVSLAEMVRGIEGALARAYTCDRINYLMLMLVDPHVHWHVVPRYAAEREAVGLTFEDQGWPGPPRLDAVNPCKWEYRAEIRDTLRVAWHGEPR